MIEGVFELRYILNAGAAFGILQNATVFFLVLGGLISAVVIAGIIRMPAGKHYRPLEFSMLLLFSGALGNMIDRFLSQSVVDFLYFRLIDFPVFNVADIYVTVGSALLVLLLIFYYREGDLSPLISRRGEQDSAVKEQGSAGSEQGSDRGEHGYCPDEYNDDDQLTNAARGEDQYRG